MNNYKKYFEAIIDIPFLTNGIIENSYNKEYIEYLDNNIYDNKVIINSIKKIYDDKFKEIIDKSEVINMNISINDINDKIISYEINKILPNVKYIFINDYSKRYFTMTMDRNGLLLPNYFYNIDNNNSYDFRIFTSPYIDKNKYEIEIIVTDNPLNNLFETSTSLLLLL